MKNNYLLSVIVPNYNNEQYLSECLDSILNQTYKNIEVIIVDDASTDDSKKILEKYDSEYAFIKVIYNKVNQGVTKNRDVAINLALGEYITTIDSDDYYIDKQKLEKEIEIIKGFQEKGKYNIISFSNIVLINAQGKLLFPNAKNKIEEGNVLVQLFCRSCMVPRDFVFSKKQYEEVGGYDCNIPIYEDWDLKLRLAKNNDFFYTGVDGIGYRRHGAGLSSANAAKHIKWLNYIYKKNIQLVASEKRSLVETQFTDFLKKSFNVSLEKKLKMKLKKILGWKI